MPEEEDAPQMAKPFEPIPMPYTPLKKSDPKEENDKPTEKHVEKQSKNKKNKHKTTKGPGNSDDMNKPDGIKVN